MSVSALFADLYEFTMLEAYHALGMDKTAVFSLFVRKLPPHRNFLIACGLETLLDDIDAFRFQGEDIAHLASLHRFRPEFLSWLKTFRFSGDIYAMPEGTPVFANEPILEIVAPIAQGQLLETLVLNQIGFQTMIASKAARIVEAAQGRDVVDFGGRRAHGLDAAIKGARAAFVAGVSATSNVQAASEYGIPAVGTVAHSFIQAFPSEMKAFRAFADLFPNTTLLVDTYDTLAGVEAVAALAREVGASFEIQAVRLDSGNLLKLSRGARQILDGAGLGSVRIFASGSLDEWKIDHLVGEGAPIDAFGVGTSMMVSTDAPAFDIAYKLTEYDGIGRMKLSAGKRILPGRKQVFRHFREGHAVGDIIARNGETLPGQPLLQLKMSRGRRHQTPLPLARRRERTAEMIAELPESIRRMEVVRPPYPVGISERLNAFEVQSRRVAIKAGGPKPLR
ncbi:nicotinate phosphoribosyltransferase pncB2 [Mesorhizobium huakuii]|uniref:nicotinate phosphoribosyltransferase n=1 Tax=Mesorhizobium huakuii TaxID=28104 RepID=UPI00235C6799|nr:nicotinate phosphoribosyltransferase [Mesorhizobium huakuii]GLQ79594.1 nicotinate phosphoribosyltransferase pncB2 [Mesorhizobium huakuii]